ncbi:MAG: capsid protein [chimpanzee associated cyclovirus 2]|uniref:capsid protein n=1 Tax=chimpanzee associated cyclovirus 2 TaxID=3003943 RepID=UPI00400E69FB|nr:MAG: capsid protein [chimpanzee associated cyclovirus 2]
MAFRRRTVRTRRRLRPTTRRVFKRRVVRKRKVKRSNLGNLTCLVRHTSIQNVQSDNSLTVIIKPALDDFFEGRSLKTNFEAFRIHSVSVRVVPHFNISTGGNDCPPYVTAPYKTDIDPGTLNIDRILTIDKAKLNHGWRGTARAFVPAVLSDISYAGDGGTLATTNTKINWRPRMEINCSSDKVPHYCGIIHFDKALNPATPKFIRVYQIVTTAKVTFYGQRTLDVKCLK